MTWGWFFLIAIGFAFFYSQSLHNKADDPRIHDAIRDDSRKSGHKFEVTFFILVGIAIFLYFIGVISG